MPDAAGDSGNGFIIPETDQRRKDFCKVAIYVRLKASLDGFRHLGTGGVINQCLHLGRQDIITCREPSNYRTFPCDLPSPGNAEFRIAGVVAPAGPSGVFHTECPVGGTS